MPTVKKIPALVSRRTAVSVPVQRKRNTAGYARVSTDKDEQFVSYEAQVDYYTRYIKEHNDWKFVGVYTDEGITGTSTKYRAGFKQMIEDARAGKIDLIVTKSISRFARNTVDSLTTIRLLKKCGTEVYFEKENIWTFDKKGELLITIMSSLAQEESRSISENVTWGHRKRMADGRVLVPFSSFLGYRRGEQGEMVIDEKQAGIVRDIYSWFLRGLSPHTIAKRLMQNGVPNCFGGEKWYDSTIRNILVNEKYKGDVLMQKFYTKDFLTKKKVVNEGKLPKYYVKDDHEAIIDPETFDLVQREFVHRKTYRRYSGIDIFSSHIFCGECGCCFGAKVWHSKEKFRRKVYRCNGRYQDPKQPHGKGAGEKNDTHSVGARPDGEKFSGRKCDTPHLYEEEIRWAFVVALNKLIANRAEMILKHTGNFGENCYTRDLLPSMIDVLNGVRRVDGFDEELWGILLDHMTVYSQSDIRCTFRDGSEVCVNLMADHL